MHVKVFQSNQSDFMHKYIIYNFIIYLKVMHEYSLHHHFCFIAIFRVIDKAEAALSCCVVSCTSLTELVVFFNDLYFFFFMFRYSIIQNDYCSNLMIFMSIFNDRSVLTTSIIAIIIGAKLVIF